MQNVGSVQQSVPNTLAALHARSARSPNKSQHQPLPAPPPSTTARQANTAKAVPPAATPIAQANVLKAKAQLANRVNATPRSTNARSRDAANGVAGTTSAEKANGASPATSMFGDVNGDGTFDLTDAQALLRYLFQGGERPAGLANADANGDGGVDISDVIHLYNVVRGQGPYGSEMTETAENDHDADDQPNAIL